MKMVQWYGAVIFIKSHAEVFNSFPVPHHNSSAFAKTSTSYNTLLLLDRPQIYEGTQLNIYRSFRYKTNQVDSV